MRSRFATCNATSTARRSAAARQGMEAGQQQVAGSLPASSDACLSMDWYGLGWDGDGTATEKRRRRAARRGGDGARRRRGGAREGKRLRRRRMAPSPHALSPLCGVARCSQLLAHAKVNIPQQCSKLPEPADSELYSPAPRRPASLPINIARPSVFPLTYNTGRWYYPLGCKGENGLSKNDRACGAHCRKDGGRKSIGGF